MPGKTARLLPSTERLLQALGERLRLARLRRRLPAKQVAERAGMTVPTLRGIERGSPNVTLGAYASVMQVLQLEAGLVLMAKDDPLGRQLQDKALISPLTARRSRAPTKAAPMPGNARPKATHPTTSERAVKTTHTGSGTSSEELLKLLAPGSPKTTLTPSPAKPAAAQDKSHKSKPR
jgi:transcriptional regulator with XRE-family HTH domain